MESEHEWKVNHGREYPHHIIESEVAYGRVIDKNRRSSVHSMKRMPRMASSRQNLPKHLPRANPETQEEEDHRTEITSEYRGAKISARIGRRHSMLLWAMTYAIIVLSTVAALTVIASILKNLGWAG